LRRIAIVVLLAASLLCSAPVKADEGNARYDLHVEQNTLGAALDEIAHRTGAQLVYPQKLADKTGVNPVIGQYTVEEALDVLLEGTGFSGGLTKGGMIFVSQKKAAQQNLEGSMKSGVTKKSLFTSVAAVVLGAVGAHAQNGASESVGQGASRGDEIVVTSQKREENMQDVPIALSVFTGDKMREFGITNTQSLQIATPGLVVSNTSNSAQPFLRGVGTRLALNGLEPSVATYVDDRYISRATASIIEFADVERIEVLKGPQGTLYGRNATGGAIRVVTKGVSDVYEGDFRAEYGNYDYYSLSGTVSVPLSEDLGIRLTGLVKGRDGFAKNLDPAGVDQLDDINFQAVKGKIRWDMTNNVTANLTLNYWWRNDNQGNDIVDLSPPGLNRGTAVGGLSGTNRKEVYTALTGDSDGEEFSGELRFDVDLGGYDLVSISTFTDLSQQFITDGDGTSAKSSDVPFAPDSLTNFSQEIQLVSPGDGRLSWIVGGYFFYEDSDLDIVADLSDFVPGFIFSQGLQTVNTTAAAAFGQATWDMTDRLSLTVGGRYSYEKKKASIVSSPNTATTLAGATLPFSDEDSWNQFTPKATLQYDFDAAMVYLTYARGFKSGGFNYPAGGGTPLNPEILDMIELGLKSDLFDNRLRFNVSGFYYDYKDLQVTRASAGINAAATTENAAQAEIFGVDLDLNWTVSDQLSIMGGVSYLDTEYKDYDAVAKSFQGTPGTVNVGFDASGQSLLRAPDWSYFVSLNYDFLIGGERFPLVVNYSYKGSYLFDFVIEPEMAPLQQDSYGLLSARLSYVTANDRLELSVWGNNLTDEEYFDDVVANGNGLRGSWGSPRTYGVSVGYRF